MSCPCGRKPHTWDLQLCGDCLCRAWSLHGELLAELAGRITYNDPDVDVCWSLDEAAVSPLSLTFRALDAYAPDEAPRDFRWVGLPDDEILALALAGASPDELLARMMSLLHFSLVSLAAHEVGEWFIVRGERPFDPHKLDQVALIEGGEDGLGALSLDMRYQEGAPLPVGGLLTRELAAELSTSARFRSGTEVVVKMGCFEVYRRGEDGVLRIQVRREWPRPQRPGRLTWEAAIGAVHRGLVEDAADRVAERLSVDGVRVFAPCNRSPRGLVPVHLDVMHEEF